MSEVHKLPGAVCNFCDADYYVLFSNRWGNMIVHHDTGETIPVHRYGGTYHMKAWLQQPPPGEVAVIQKQKEDCESDRCTERTKEEEQPEDQDHDDEGFGQHPPEV